MSATSKYLSYLLRHKPEDVNAKLDCHGWMDVDTLISNSEFTMQTLKEIVMEDTRYEFNADKTKIRAFHGHSVPGIIPYTEITPTCKLYHGTSERGFMSILADGMIKSMSRNYVHLSSDPAVAERVGKRHGKPVVLEINVEEMINNGFKFYESGDNVTLTNDIPYKYVKCVANGE